MIASPLEPKKDLIRTFHFVDYGLWFRPPLSAADFYRGTLPTGVHKNHRVNWSTLVTSLAFRVEVVTEIEKPLPAGALILVDYGKGIELARVEATRLAWHVAQLRECQPPFEFKGKSYRWVILEMVRALTGSFAIGGRKARLDVETSQQAYDEFLDFKRGFNAPVTTDLELSPVGKVAWGGKWMALGDMHSKAIKFVEAAAREGIERIDTPEVVGLLQSAAKEFAIDFNSLWRHALSPISAEKRQRRKDLRRRKCEMDCVDRYLVCNWEGSLHAMTSTELAEHIAKVFGPKFKFSVKTIRQRRYRLGLFPDWEGHPGNK